MAGECKAFRRRRAQGSRSPAARRPCPVRGRTRSCPGWSAHAVGEVHGARFCLHHAAQAPSDPHRAARRPRRHAGAAGPLRRGARARAEVQGRRARHPRRPRGRALRRRRRARLLPPRHRGVAPAGAHAAAAHGRRVAGPRRAPPRRPQGGRRAPRPGAAVQPPAPAAAAHGPPGAAGQRPLVLQGARLPDHPAARHRAAGGRLRDRQARLAALRRRQHRSSACCSASSSSPRSWASSPCSGAAGRRPPARRRAPPRAADVCGRYSLASPDPARLRERFAIGDDGAGAPALQRRARRRRPDRHHRPRGRAARRAAALGPRALLGQGPQDARPEAHQRALGDDAHQRRLPRRAPLPGHRRRLLRVGEAPRRAQAAVVGHAPRRRAVRLRRAVVELAPGRGRRAAAHGGDRHHRGLRAARARARPHAGDAPARRRGRVAGPRHRARRRCSTSACRSSRPACARSATRSTTRATTSPTASSPPLPRLTLF